MGVWIETPQAMISRGLNPSHPAWVCGLKPDNPITSILFGKVTPCVGVWIETSYPLEFSISCLVTPCVGVWIETQKSSQKYFLWLSHPAWVCGLKLHQSCRP